MGASSQGGPCLKIVIANAYIAQNPYEIDITIIPILQLRKPRCKQVKQITNITQ